MTLGAQPNKVKLLVVLGVVAVVALYMNVFSGDSEKPAAAPQRAPVVADTGTVTSEPAAPRVNSRRAGRGSNASAEIKFRQGAARPKDPPDPATIDPTLRLDLLAKIQNVEPQAAMRNIFQYGSAPSPAPAKLPPLPVPPPQILTARGGPPATAPPPGPLPPPRPPTAPPMTFKYYGYVISKVDGTKQAFLLDGDDIIVTTENAPVKRGRYRVVAIGLTSITIEDTQFKSNQTLRIVEDAAG